MGRYLHWNLIFTFIFSLCVLYCKKPVMYFVVLTLYSALNPNKLIFDVPKLSGNITLM